MSAFLDFPLPCAFEKFNINIQINQSQSAFVFKRVADKQIYESASQLKVAIGVS